MTANPPRPSANLLGKTLGRWLVIEHKERAENLTGGFFSESYVVKEVATGQIAFLKAIDLLKRQPDLEAIRRGIEDYQYERQLLELCEQHAMSRIVRALDTGIYEESYGELIIPTPYIVFELAEGDVRSHRSASTFNLGWRLRIFHGACAAIRQLHSAGIAHQDLKPSNVLVFQRDRSKVADLGRATRDGAPSRFEWDIHVGDKNYQPFELLYNELLQGHWMIRRFGADFFMVGCLLTFLVTDSSLLTLVYDKLDRNFWHDRWGAGYQAVIPHLHHALVDVLADVRGCLPAGIGTEVAELIYSFCEPDPRKRGLRHNWSRKMDAWEDPVSALQGQYDLQYAISRADSLAYRCTVSGDLMQPTLRQERFVDFVGSR